jgi:hypothetical protein
VIGSGQRNSAGNHVGIANRLDLLRPYFSVRSSNRLKMWFSKATTSSGVSGADLGVKPNYVREQHGNAVEVVRDNAAFFLEARCNRLGQHVEKEHFRFRAFRFQRNLGAARQLERVEHKPDRKQAHE